MSYDLQICKDDCYSAFIDLAPLKAFIAALPHIISNGDDFALDDPSTSRWMEIYLELVDEEGDTIEEVQDYTQINCIRLCIPYGRLNRESLEQDYLQVARAISEFVNWTLTDLQTAETY